MNVEILFAGDEEIEDFLQINHQALFYHSGHYLKLLSKILSADCFYITVKRNGVLNSIMPVMVKRSKLGVIYNSLPYFGSNGSVVQSDRSLEEQRLILKTFFCKAKADQALTATVILNPFDVEDENLWQKLGVGTMDFRIGQITYLPQNKEDLMSCFQNPRPRNIRKAIKSDVNVSIVHEEGLEFLYKTHRENISSIGGTPKTWSFFSAIPDFIPYNKWKIYLAELDGIKISALLLFYQSRTVEYFTPATNKMHKSLQPSSLLIYRAMNDAIDAGFSNWNWGGTWQTQAGVYDFKKKWGAKDQIYNYKTFVFDDRVFGMAKEALLQNFPGFYVVDFAKLKECQDG